LNKKHKILFFVYAGKRVGYGHLARCLALAEAFSDESYQCSFIIKTDDSKGAYDFLEKRTAYSFDINLIKLNEADHIELNLILDEYEKGPSFLILDHYGHDEQYRIELKKKGIRWAQFDYKKNERIIYNCRCSLDN